jgi:hypothetical protein
MRKLFLAVAILTTACGPFHRGPSGGATVVFNNQTTDQADVYATSGLEPIRIGTVFGGQTSSLNVPATVVGSGSMSIIAHLLAGPNISSGSFTIGAGQTAEIRLPSDKRNLVITAVH